jgi:hypothetical protein
MAVLSRIKDFIRGLDERELYLYMGGFLAFMLLLLGLLIYLHYSRVNRYMTDLKRLDTQRGQTRKILSNYKSVNLQQARVEEILAENKNFRIGEAYGTIINRLRLGGHQQELPTPTSGETVSGKTEVLLHSHLTGISMKQLTDLLSEIANVIQMYPKDLVIKKMPNAQAVDVDLTVATLEPAATSE